MEIDRRTKSRSINTLKTRAEFQRVRGGGRASTPAFVLEGKPRPSIVQPLLPDATGAEAGPDALAASDGAASGPRFGFTITKKVGNAVVRNRIRRRLRAALGELAGDFARRGTDYVVVAREPAAELEFAKLLAGLKAAFERVHAASANPAPDSTRHPKHRTAGSGKDRKGVTEELSRPPARSATSTHPSKSSRD